MGNAPPSRLTRERAFPAYAYLPGSDLPHPVRDPRGHSYEQESPPVAGAMAPPADALRWGMDLFNHGYYWEAHEAWEPLWLAARDNPPDRALFKGLIMLAATGVKIRERKWVAALRHARRAARSLRQLPPGPDLVSRIGMTPEALASLALETAARVTTDLPVLAAGRPDPVFPFLLGTGGEDTPSMTPAASRSVKP